MSGALAKQMIPEAIRRPLGQLRRYSAHPGLAWAQLRPLGEMMAALAPPKHPPILLVSMPRGGSSWAGRILGSSEQSLYLHEPVTQSYLRLLGGKGVSEFEYEVCRRPRDYLRAAGHALRGVPRFAESVVLFPEQWRSVDRHAKRVVVKEVNPLALDTLIAEFQPRVIYLLRHPAAVARSYHALGWAGTDQFRKRFSPGTLAELEPAFHLPHDGDVWEQSGALQALVQHRAMAALAAWPDHTTVRYEDLCLDPVGTFARLLSFCELPLTEALKEEIERTSRSAAGYKPGGSDTARDSRAMADRWKHELDPETIASVRRGYIANRPLFYDSADDW
ncbi:sulfotransferase [Thalassobaculum sp.]|uniref:sulfotransferase family protein n=1 Tax=Thalassobaculum sp. TaxID=2022740 RepID=UPI0032EED79E